MRMSSGWKRVARPACTQRKYSNSVQFAEIARRPVCQVCMCALIKPGIRMKALPSKSSASGAWMRSPTAAIRPPSTSTSPGRKSPCLGSIVMTVAFWISNLRIGFSRAGVRLPSDKLSAARFADKFSVFDNRTPARKHAFRQPLHFDSLEHRVIDLHMMRRCADHLFGIRIEHDEIGIRADGDRALARIESEKLRRSGGDKLHETIRRKSSGVHSAAVNQTQAVLDARATVGNLREVVPAKFLLLLHAERAVIGRDDL